MSPFQIHPIPFTVTGKFSGLLMDYLAGKPQLDAFYSYRPEAGSFPPAMASKSFGSEQREILVEVLQSQYTGIHLQDEVNENIEAFRNPATFCAVTAHQLNVLTGPLYVIYKAQSVIDLCNFIQQKNQENKLVPVFWLGSEDHDLEEINHVDLAESHVTWNTQQKGPTGRMRTAGMGEMIREVQAATGNNVLAKEWIAAALEAYEQAENLTAATRVLLHTLFGKQGLVIFDGDHPAMKAQFAPVMLAEVEHGTAGKLAKQTSVELAADYGAQALVRDINLFYMQDGVRERIEQNGDTYKVVNTSLTFSKQEIADALESQPEAFSPNVILRPLYQQMVLPSVAYIGGGGELAYWLQLKRVFEHFNTDFPILLLRSSVMVVSRKVSHKMRKLGISHSDIFQPQPTLVQHILHSEHASQLTLDTEKVSLSALFDALRDRASQIDPTLEKAALAAGARAEKQLEKLEKKMLRAAKRRSATEISQLQQILDDLFPHGHLQERHYNITEMLARYGHSFLEQLEGKLNPLQYAFLIFEEGE